MGTFVLNPNFLIFKTKVVALTAASFSVSQTVGLPDTVTLTDTSTGSDATIAARIVYLQKADGTYLTGSGSDEIITAEVDAVSYIGGVTLRTTGIAYSVYVNDPVLGTILIASYTQVVSETLTTLVTALIAAINNGSSGYTAENYTATTLNVIAKDGLGATINGLDATVSWDNGSSVNDFAGGVTEVTLPVDGMDYNYWSYADSTVDYDLLDKDYALKITVSWLDGDGATIYSTSGEYGLTSYNEDFDYDLTTILASNPLLINDNSFKENKSNLRLYIDSGDNAILRSSDIVSAQQCYTEATNIRLGSIYYFNESNS